MKYGYTAYSKDGICDYDGNAVSFTSLREATDARFFLDIDIEDYENDAYVMLPACAYDGNRFKSVKRDYAPMYRSDEVGENEEPLIMRGIPSLGKDGEKALECTAGDMASPIVCVFLRKAREALFVFTEQEVKGKNIGYSIKDGKITLQFPANRTYAYRFHNEPDPDPDNGIEVRAGEKISTRVLIRAYPCQDIPELFNIYMRERKLLCRDERPGNGYTPELLEVMLKHMNEHNWSGKYYGNTLWITWQLGWTGGGISSYPMYMLGDEESKDRAVATLDFMTDFISSSGLIHGVVYNFKDVRDDSKYLAIRSEKTFSEYEHMKGSHLVRRSGDALIFLIKQLRSPMPKKQKWIDATRGVCDAMVKVFKRYGTFGQYVNTDTLEMTYRGTSSGASLVGGLALASEYFLNPEYLEVAKEAGEYYYKNFLSRGITNGGPGDALSAPDSESSFAFIESYVTLYEITGDKKWLDYAEVATNVFSSWVMTYSYKFPPNCEFGILGINTVGSVFANVQNKHSAPGICTFSGDSIYKLYKYTENALYLELIKDIAYFMPQCVSRKDRPIYDWDHEHGDPLGMLPEGYICERVNTSDWEYDKYVGGVFNVSCWCETSILLTYLELMDKPEMQ